MAKKVEIEGIVAEVSEKTEEMTGKAVDKAKEAGKGIAYLFRKVLLASVGAAVVAEEELVSLINRLAERGEIAENDAKEMIKEVLDKRQKEANETIDKIRYSNTIKVATKSDIDALQEKIETLSAKVDAMKAE